MAAYYVRDYNDPELGVNLIRVSDDGENVHYYRDGKWIPDEDSIGSDINDNENYDEVSLDEAMEYINSGKA